MKNFCSFLKGDQHKLSLKYNLSSSCNSQSKKRQLYCTQPSQHTSMRCGDKFTVSHPYGTSIYLSTYYIVVKVELFFGFPQVLSNPPLYFLLLSWSATKAYPRAIVGLIWRKSRTFCLRNFIGIFVYSNMYVRQTALLLSRVLSHASSGSPFSDFTWWRHCEKLLKPYVFSPLSPVSIRKDTFIWILYSCTVVDKTPIIDTFIIIATTTRYTVL